MYWQPINRTNITARGLADKHYNRKSVGHREWLPPCAEYVALLGVDRLSLWACCYQKFRRDRLDCFDNTYFRHEAENTQAIDLIKEATQITLMLMCSKPIAGIITFIDPASVAPTFVHSVPTWGRTYVKAGYRFFGATGRGKLMFQYLAPRLFLAARAAA